MRIPLPILIIACAILSTASLSRAEAAPDQPRGAERVIHHSKAEVEKTIQALHTTLTGRLPILEGFATESDQQWDHFTRGYYECAVQLTANGQNDTSVRVTAKITAWFTDLNAAQSGYRELLSNGRVEADLLDRIEESLATQGTGSAVPQPSPLMASSAEASVRSSAALPPARLRPEIGRSPVVDAPGIVRGERSSISPNHAGSPVVGVTSSSNHSEDFDALRRRREEAEKKLSELTSVVQNLDEILRNQTHPADIAVVRKSGTHVMSKPNASGPVLFAAESEDEFQVLENGPDWVHVQISGASRGWIRRSDLNLPEGLNSHMNRASAAVPTDEPPFRVIREETNVFKGNWEQLSGKMVKIVWTGPSSAQVKPPSPVAKKNFAKSLLGKAYQEMSDREQTVAGVVIVFDAADGGQIASTLENLKQWQSGGISEAAFWRLCSVDPPELFAP